MQGHRISFIGNLGRDPEMRYTPDGTPVTNFSVATNRKWNVEGGSQGEETIWFRVTVWRRLAETCNEYLAKGRQVYVEGRLRADPETGGPRIWTGRDGEPRASFELTAQAVRFLSGGNGGSRPATDEGPPAEDEDDSIPF